VADGGGVPKCGDGVCGFPAETDLNCPADCKPGGFDGGGTDGADSGVADSGVKDSGVADSGGADAGAASCGGKADGSKCVSGKLCMANETCLASVCQGGIVSCDDGNSCTADLCAANGCTHTNANDGTACNSGDPCTANDACKVGACVAGPSVCGNCNDTALACGGTTSILFNDFGASSLVNTYSCAPKTFKTSAKEVSIVSTALCAGTNTTIVRAYGVGNFGISLPIEQQTAHVYLIDEVGSLGKCGDVTQGCNDLTFKQQACGTSGPAPKPGCKAEWVVTWTATGPGKRRIIVDTLTNTLTEIEAILPACNCNNPSGAGVCGDLKCNPLETCDNCPKDCGLCNGGNAVCGNKICEAVENCSNCALDCGACGGGGEGVCGDGVCNFPSETDFTCPADCKK